MNTGISGIMEVTKYAMPPAVLDTPRGLTQEVYSPMRPKYTHIPTQTEYDIDEETGAVIVPLGTGKGNPPNGFALVDLCDVDRVLRFPWQLEPRGFTNYARTSRTGKRMHQVVLEGECGDGQEIDHENHNGLDNRRSNLRVATSRQNSMNKQCRNPHGYKGVRCAVAQNGNVRWYGYFTYRQKQEHLGRFDSPEEAGRAYDRRAREVFGEFAHLNFPEEHL